MKKSTIIVIALVAIAAIWGVSAYNGLVKMDEFACLEVAWVNEYGAFLDWGLMKDLFVPFREQKMKMQKGHRYVVHAHVDEDSYRIMASAKVEKYLSKDMPPYQPGEEVEVMTWL